MNTIEKNKIIAEFMGLNEKIVHFEKFYSWSDAPFFYTTEDSKEKVVENISKYAKYHSDWNWLMEAIEKISEMIMDYHDRVFEGSDELEKFYDLGLKNITYSEDEIKISISKQFVYEDVISFIKWHNEQK